MAAEAVQGVVYEWDVVTDEVVRSDGLKALLGCERWPQLLLRVGFCMTPPAPTPRKPLEQMLLAPAQP